MSVLKLVGGPMDGTVADVDAPGVIVVLASALGDVWAVYARDGDALVWQWSDYDDRVLKARRKTLAGYVLVRAKPEPYLTFAENVGTGFKKETWPVWAVKP